jgi:hypothetical protein
MGKKELPVPVIATVIVVIVLIVGVVLYKGATGGTVGTGEPGKVMASPPVPGGNKRTD